MATKKNKSVETPQQKKLREKTMKKMIEEAKSKHDENILKELAPKFVK